MNTTQSTATDRMQAKLDSLDVDTLLAASAHLYSVDTPESDIAGPMVAETITRRLRLDDALDEVFADETFQGTYHDAIVRAIATTHLAGTYDALRARG